MSKKNFAYLAQLERQTAKFMLKAISGGDKMKNALAKEIKPALKQYTKDVEDLRKKAEKRRANLQQWKETRDAKLQEVKNLEDRAHELIDSGDDPETLL